MQNGVQTKWTSIVEKLRDEEVGKGQYQQHWDSSGPVPLLRLSRCGICEKERVPKQRATAVAVSKEGRQVSVRARSWNVWEREYELQLSSETRSDNSRGSKKMGEEAGEVMDESWRKMSREFHSLESRGQREGGQSEWGPPAPLKTATCGVAGWKKFRVPSGRFYSDDGGWSLLLACKCKSASTLLPLIFILYQ